MVIFNLIVICFLFAQSVVKINIYLKLSLLRTQFCLIPIALVYFRQILNRVLLMIITNKVLNCTILFTGSISNTIYSYLSAVCRIHNVVASYLTIHTNVFFSHSI